jgi:hypothetical protein
VADDAVFMLREEGSKSSLAVEELISTAVFSECVLWLSLVDEVE